MLLPHLKTLSLAKAGVAAIRKPTRIKHRFFIVDPPFFRDTGMHPQFAFWKIQETFKPCRSKFLSVMLQQSWT
jgi:hypothetical protein